LDEKEVISNSADTWMPSACRQKQQKALNFVIVSNFSVIIIIQSQLKSRQAYTSLWVFCVFDLCADCRTDYIGLEYFLSTCIDTT